jgi:uncharacterized protein (DUF433 family)
MSAAIIDRGRGPEIEGTRITVYDILDYEQEGWHHTRIASFLGLSTEQVLTAIRYIADHRTEVMADYQEMLDRSARGNPPEVEARRLRSHAKLQDRMKELKRGKVAESILSPNSSLSAPARIPSPLRG